MGRLGNKAKLSSAFATGVVECFAFAGVFNGWPSLVFVLRKDEYFSDLCPPGHNYSQSGPRNDSAGCALQDERFALIYTIGSFLMNFTIVGSGLMLDSCGIFVTRFVAIFLYTTGTLIIAFSTADSANLLFPSIALIGIGGVCLLTTNLKTGILFGSKRSTVITVYNGAYSSSPAIFLVVKVVYEAGFSLRTIFLFISILSVLHVLRTIFLLPWKSIPYPLPAGFTYGLNSEMFRSIAFWRRNESATKRNPQLGSVELGGDGNGRRAEGEGEGGEARKMGEREENHEQGRGDTGESKGETGGDTGAGRGVAEADVGSGGMEGDIAEGKGGAKGDFGEGRGGTEGGAGERMCETKGVIGEEREETEGHPEEGRGVTEGDQKERMEETAVDTGERGDVEGDKEDGRRETEAANGEEKWDVKSDEAKTETEGDSGEGRAERAERDEGTVVVGGNLGRGHEQPANGANGTDGLGVDVQENEDPSFRSCVFSWLFLTSFLMFSVIQLRIHFFSGTLNPMLSRMTGGDVEQVSSFTNAFAFTQLFSILCSPWNGLILDRHNWRRRRSTQVSGSAAFQRLADMKSSVLSIVITVSFSVLFSVSAAIPVLEVQYLTFALYMLSRAFVNGGLSAFLAMAFPPCHFGKLYGITRTLTALVSLLQYPFFVLVKGPLRNNPLYMNIALIAMVIPLYAHAINVYFYCRRESQKRGREASPGSNAEAG